MKVMIKNIIFDIGEVLVDFIWEEHMRNLGFPEETVQALGSGWVKTPLWDELDRGVLSEDEALGLAKRALPQYSAQIDMFWNNPDGIVRCRPQSAGWLSSLKNRGYKVYLLSNYPRSLFEAHSEREFSFIPFIDGKVVSSSIGVMKPDRRIYQTLLDRYSLTAEECLFADDRQVNLDGAAQLGIRTLLVRNIDDAMADMDAILENDRNNAI